MATTYTYVCPQSSVAENFSRALRRAGLPARQKGYTEVAVTANTGMQRASMHAVASRYPGVKIENLVHDEGEEVPTA